MKKRTILGVIATMLIAFLLTGCGKKELKAELKEANDQCKKLQAEVADLKEQLSELELKNASLIQQANVDANETYLALVFPEDGNFYTVLDENFYFYLDQRCEQKVSKEVRIISPTIEERTRDNGFSICVCMSEQGLVYATSWPNLVVIDN